MKKMIFVLIPLGVFLTSCDLLNQTTTGLTNDEIVNGLKTALIVGADTSVALTSKTDAIYSDIAIRILLPPEAEIINQHKDDAIFAKTGITYLIETAIHSMNRSAEDAAPKAKDILVSAITNLSITEALSILKGTNPAGKKSSSGFDSTAATAYLKSTTYAALKIAFQPKIDESLNTPLLAGISTNVAWNNMTSVYNTGANTYIGQNVLGLTPVNVNLSDYVTQKALDILFLKVADEERKIRRDPLKWAATAVGDILKKVFGK